MTATSVPRPSAWQSAAVVSIRAETPQVTTIEFAVPNWPGHFPGQHADVRLTAENGYRAERSFSIASPPEQATIELTVGRLDDGEVSPFLTTQLRTGDTIQLRGPIGGYFIWSAAQRRPLLLIAGGTGVVPLMCMLRHRALSKSVVPTTLFYSARTRHDIVFHRELTALARHDPEFRLEITLTRDPASDWPGRIGHIDLAAVQELLERLGGMADSFICGPDAFVETASALLRQAGQSADSIRTERFGPTG